MDIFGKPENTRAYDWRRDHNRNVHIYNMNTGERIFWDPGRSVSLNVGFYEVTDRMIPLLDETGAWKLWNGQGKYSDYSEMWSLVPTFGRRIKIFEELLAPYSIIGSRRSYGITETSNIMKKDINGYLNHSFDKIHNTSALDAGFYLNSPDVGQSYSQEKMPPADVPFHVYYAANLLRDVIFTAEIVIESSGATKRNLLSLQWVDVQTERDTNDRLRSRNPTFSCAKLEDVHKAIARKMIRLNNKSFVGAIQQDVKMEQRNSELKKQCEDFGKLLDFFTNRTN